MRVFLKRISNFVLNSYFIFYLSLFVTDFSFILKNRLNNIAGFTGLLIFLLLLRYFVESDSLGELYLFRLIRRVAHFSDKKILFLIFLFLTVAISALGVGRHLSFSTVAFDMGIFDQAVWNTLKGDILFSSIRGNMNLLGDHFEPILFLLVPFYAVLPHVFTLIFIQALVLAAAIFPLYLIAKDKLNSRFLVFVLIVSFALSKALRGVGLSDFHPDSFMVPLSFLSFYSLIKRKNFLLFLTLFFLLACKEVAILIPLGLGIYSCFFLRRLRLGLSLVIIAISAWVLETKFIIPHFNVYREYLFNVRMPFGQTYSENFRFVIGHPLKSLGVFLSPPKINYLTKLLGPLGFSPLFAPAQYILILMPLTVVLFASSALWGYYLVTSHYVAPILAFIYIGAIYGLSNMLKFISARSWFGKKISLRKISLYLGTYILALSLFYYGKTDAYKFMKFIDGIKSNQSFQKLSYIKEIPEAASVTATSYLVPHLSHRKYIYDWNSRKELGFMTDYTIIDLDYLGVYSKEEVLSCFSQLQKIGYKEVFSNSQKSFFIFFNPSSDKKKLENFHENIL